MKNEEDVQIKEFVELYQLVSKDLTRFKKRLQRTELLPSQKTLLWAYHSYRKRDSAEALQKLKSVSFKEGFFAGVRNYLIGIAYNHIGKFAFAREHLLLARASLKSSSHSDFKLLNLATLIFCYSNQNVIGPVHELMDELQELDPLNDYEKILKDVVRVKYLSDTEQMLKSNKSIDHIISKSPPYYAVFEANLRIMKLVNFFKLKKYESCYEELEHYNQSTGFKCTSNYKFVKTLLDHITKKSVLYVYQYDFEDSVEQFEQLMVIKSLAENDKRKAEGFWKNLSKHNPETYQENFVYVGGSTIFQAALERNLSSDKSSFDPQELASIPSINKKLDYLFVHGPDKMRKADLIHWLWGEEDCAQARVKLRRALQYHQEKHGSTFKSYQDCYLVQKKAS